MRKRNWAEMKAMNALMVAASKPTKQATNVSAVTSTMLVEDCPRLGRRYVSQREAVRRYDLREERREGTYGRNVFRDCTIPRPCKRKVQNRASREAAGTIPNITMGIRTGKYSVCVCKAQNKWN